jgi:hypothetical protein
MNAEIPRATEHPPEVYLKRIADDMKIMRQQLTEVIAYMRDAESEIPERMRRFIMYMHDVHDICNLYVEGGQMVPRHVHAEMERCDDRYRQILEEMHTDGGTFEKVRSEMAKDPLNRWDHTRQLAPPKPKEG